MGHRHGAWASCRHSTKGATVADSHLPSGSQPPPPGSQPPPPPSSLPPPPSGPPVGRDGGGSKPWWKRWWVIAGAVVVLAAIGNLAETSSGGDPEEADAAATTPSETPTAEDTPEASPEPSPTPTPVDVPDVAGMTEQEALLALRRAGFEVNVTEQDVTTPDEQGLVLEQRPPAGMEREEGTSITIVVGGEFVWQDSIVLEGNGDDVIVDFEIPGDAPAIVTATAQGRGNFVVRNYDADRQELDLLFNALPPYEGMNMVNVFTGEETREIEVQAPGPWTLTFEPIINAPALNETLSGESDAIVVVPGDSDARVFHFLHTGGGGNVVVRAYGESGEDLLVNEIGETDVRARWPSGVRILQIQAEGSWTIELLDS